MLGLGLGLGLGLEVGGRVVGKFLKSNKRGLGCEGGGGCRVRERDLSGLYSKRKMILFLFKYYFATKVSKI